MTKAQNRTGGNAADSAEFDDWRARYDAAIATYEAMAERRRERKLAKKSLVLIDNWIDDTVLTMLEKRGAGVKCTVYTSGPRSRTSASLYSRSRASSPPLDDSRAGREMALRCGDGQERDVRGGQRR